MPKSPTSTNVDAKKAKTLLARFFRIQAIRERSLQLMINTVKKVNNHKFQILKKKLEELTNGS